MAKKRKKSVKKKAGVKRANKKSNGGRSPSKKNKLSKIKKLIKLAKFGSKKGKKKKR